MDETEVGSPAGSGRIEGTLYRQGDRLERFVVDGKLGEGGVGVVLAARDPDLGRRVAIKLLRPSAYGDARAEEARARLLREAQAMAQLVHPNVVTVYQVGTVADEVFVAMEFVDGGTLRDWLARGDRDWREIVAALCEAGRGLAAAHAAGMVHRDFKPDNVLVGRDGRMRVTDFGLVGTDAVDAGAAEPAPLSGSLTQTGAVMGTPRYMAPEQHGDEVDARADQFSFCVALYEALYGQHPFAGDTSEALRDAALAGRVREPPADSEVPDRVRAAILRGLAADPVDRFASMEDLLAELDVAPVRRRRGPYVVAAAVFAVGGIAAVAWAVRAGGGPDPCAAAGDRVAQLWNDELRARAGAAVADTETFDQLAMVLDRYAVEWRGQREAACRSGAATDQRCLDDALANLAQITASLDTADVYESLRAAYLLPAPASCSEPVPAATECEGAAGLNPLEPGRVWVYQVIDPGTGLRDDAPKVIRVGPEQEVGGCKPDQRALRVERRTDRGFGYRWQEVRDTPTGTLTVRHRDQWFEPDGTPTRDEYYEPGRIRIDETCDHLRPGARWRDAYLEFDVDPGSCERRATRVPAFDWDVVAVGRPLELTLDYANPACCPSGGPCGPPPDGVGHSCTPKAGGSGSEWTCRFDTTAVRRREVNGTTEATYWFAPGVGKVHEETTGVETEDLVCFAGQLARSTNWPASTRSGLVPSDQATK